MIEKRIIHLQFADPTTEFFDEYRRIMFVLLGDLAYFKRTQVEKYMDREQLDSDIFYAFLKQHTVESVDLRIQYLNTVNYGPPEPLA